MDGMHFPRYGRKSGDGSPEAPPAPAPTPTVDPGDLARQVKGAMDETKSFAERTITEFRNLGRVTEETKARADEALTRLGELGTKHAEILARLDDVEQKAARRGSERQDPPALRTIGDIVVEDEQVKSGVMGGTFRGTLRVQMSRKDIMSASSTVGTGVSPSTSLVVADRQPGIVAPPMRRLTIRDLLAPGTTTSSHIEYVKEASFTNNAAPVAEGAAKPKSDITFDMASSPVRTLAHIFKASRQILDDADQLRSYINARAEYGLKLKEEQQLLTGSGSGQNILGIVPQATAFAVPSGFTASTVPDRIRAALLQAVLAEYPPSGIVLNPIDWASMEVLKDDQGRYLFADIQGVATPRLWGLPVVATQAMAQGAFLVGAFNVAAQVFDRMDVEILLSTENVDDFEKNMVTIRCEERLALAVYRPAAFITGDLDGV